jgi:uncharacterized protein YjiK
MDIKKLIISQSRLFNLMIYSMILFDITMACIDTNEGKNAVISSGQYSYSLDKPDEKFDLPGRLEEISGLDYLGDKILLCIEDEEGVLYFYNLKEKEVTREIKFGKNGDYEGVAHIGNIAYVIRSDGKLFIFPIDRDDEVDARSYDTPFRGRNDLEGLSTGHQKDELYMACKGEAEVNNNEIKGRAVYVFDLNNNRLSEEPYIHLTSDIFWKALKSRNLSPSRHMPFKPSGIAVHPLTGDVFIIASVGKMIIVLDRNGTITGAAPLSRKILIQPEGISFNEKGTMFISSEGKNHNGYILSFKPSNIQK